MNKRAKVYSERSELDGFYSGIADFLSEFIFFEIKLFKIKVEEATELNAEAMKEEDFQCGPGVCEAEPDAKR